MGIMMELKNYTKEELEGELRRRELNIPHKVTSPNFGRIEKICDEFVSDLLQGGIHPHDNDYDHYMFEAAMETCYKDFWDWFEERWG